MTYNSNMINILDFINSSDVREHLQKIDYHFKPTEAAWIVYNCYRLNITLQNKHDAWNEIIRTMPDEPIPKRFNCAGFDSLHKFLTDYMAVEDRLIKTFYNEENAVYFGRCYARNNADWYSEMDRAFPTFKSCQADLEGDFVSTYDPNRDITVVQVKKQSLANPDEYMIVTFDTEWHIIDVNIGTIQLDEPDSTIYYESFIGLWFAIPHPFHKGDIVCDSESDGICHSAETGLCSGPFVLLGTSADNPPPRMIANGDNTDMNGWGYFQNEDGTLYYEVMWNYLDLEFYHGDLSGVKRVLTAMSNYMKDEIGEDILVKAYHYILTEEYLKSIEITDITEEGMKLAGLR